MPNKSHLVCLAQFCNLVSGSGGTLRCIAVHAHKQSVNTQDITKEEVPRPLGSDTQPTADEAFAFVPYIPRLEQAVAQKESGVWSLWRM